jgi:UrcA family protein
MSKLNFIYAAALAACVAGSAEADTIVMVSKAISYRREALKTPQGARNMLVRIERTAGDLCRPRPGRIADHTPASAEARCRRAVVADAVERLGAPLVTAAYEQRSKRRPELAAR